MWSRLSKSTSMHRRQHMFLRFLWASRLPACMDPSTKKMQDTFKKTPHLSARLSLWHPVMPPPLHSADFFFFNKRLNVTKEGQISSWIYVCGKSPQRICNPDFPSTNEAWITPFTHCDLWDVLFSLIRHLSSDSTLKTKLWRTVFPLCGCCSGPRSDGSFREWWPLCQCDVKWLRE